MAMTRRLGWAVGAALALSGGVAQAQSVVAVPSGGSVSAIGVIWETQPDGSLWARFRFLAPQIARDGGTVSYAAAAADMAHLCEVVALPAVAADGRAPGLIIVSLADRDIAFGTLDTSVTQFFEAFRNDAGQCVPEPI